jgi:hypothetical protein
MTEERTRATDGARRRTYVAMLVMSVTIIAAGLLVVAPLAFGLRFSSRRAVGSYAAELSAVTKVAGHVLILMVALGVVTMAVLETVKRLLPVRGYFHRRELRSYLSEGGFAALVRGVQIPYRNLTWFDTSAEQLFAQIGVLADQHFAMLIRSEEGSDDSTNASPSALLRTAESRIFLASLLGGKFPDIWKDISKPPSVEVIGSFVDVAGFRLREPAEHLRSQIDISLDRLQVIMTGTWRRMLRLASCTTSALVALVAIAFSPVSFGVALTTVFGAFAVGGFFAWFTRDVAAGIERWRR